MSVFEPASRHLREVLIFCFHFKETATEAHRMLQNTYGDCTLSKKRVVNGFNVLKAVILMSTQITIVRSTTLERHAGHVCEQECSNLVRTRP